MFNRKIKQDLARLEQVVREQQQEIRFLQQDVNLFNLAFGEDVAKWINKRLARETQALPPVSSERRPRRERKALDKIR